MSLEFCCMIVELLIEIHNHVSQTDYIDDQLTDPLAFCGGKDMDAARSQTQSTARLQPYK